TSSSSTSSTSPNTAKTCRRYASGGGESRANPVSSRPQLPIQRPVTDCLAEMPLKDGRRAFEIGNRASHAEDAVVSAGGQAQLFHGSLEQVAALVVEDAEPAELPAGHAAVEAMTL